MQGRTFKRGLLSHRHPVARGFGARSDLSLVDAIVVLTCLELILRGHFWLVMFGTDSSGTLLVGCPEL